MIKQRGPCPRVTLLRTPRRDADAALCDEAAAFGVAPPGSERGPSPWTVPVPSPPTALVPVAAQDLLNLMSHGLATPLTSMGVQIHLLRNGDALSDRQARALGVLERNFDRLQEHIADVAAAVRIMADPPRAVVGVVDLAESLRDAVRAEAPDAAERGVRVSVAPTPASVRADPSLLTEAVRRLVRHATAASAAGGRVSIETHVDAECATVRLADAGGRVLDHESATLFDVDAPDTFARAPAGFDLFIAAALGRIAGGVISHEHAPDGVVVALRFPRA